MKMRKNVAAWLLVMVLLISMAGCKSAGQPAEATAAATNAAVVAAEPAKDVITVYVSAPGEWDDPHIWAWKEGGETVDDVWFGMEYKAEDTYWRECLPGWIDRVKIWNAGDGSRTGDLVLVPGKDVWIAINDQGTTIYYEDPHIVVERTVVEDPFYLAAQQGDFETMKAMLPEIEDRSILTDWAYNDFNYAYARDAVGAGDYETAVEFFGYCSYPDNQLYAQIIELLVAGEWEAALDTLKSINYDSLADELDTSWGELIRKIGGFPENLSELDRMLMDRYVKQYLKKYDISFREDLMLFGESSSWMARSYVGEITDTDYYYPVANFNALKSQCGKEANGKILILRAQKGYPDGKTYYAIDLDNMDSLSADLYPASLSEVEYILLANYGYTVEGNYRQTFTSGDNSFSEDFAFLRMKGQVQLLNAANGQTLHTSQWIHGTGEVDLNFSGESYLCSDLPETAGDIISAVEQARQLNGE